MAEESKYVYVSHDYGLYRFKLAENLVDNGDDPEAFKFELVSEGVYFTQLSTMGMFTHDSKIYLVGGIGWPSAPFEYNTHIIHIFDPFKFPIGNDCFQRCAPRNDSQHLVKPYMFPTNNLIYFFSLCNNCIVGYTAIQEPVFSFQSFNPKNNTFQTLPTPTLPSSTKYEFSATYFIVLDYIYLFTRQSPGGPFDYVRQPKWVYAAFSFNTKTPPSQSQWNILDSSSFDPNIPIPYEHTGDTGLSPPFPDNRRILIALYNYKPTAYLVSLDQSTGDSLLPISHSPLIDPTSSLFYKTGRSLLGDSHLYDKSHLLNLGDDKFCVICTPFYAPLLVYIFKMDFQAEYQNLVNWDNPHLQSITILSSKEISHKDIEVFANKSLASACLASGPAPPRGLPSHVDMPSELPDKPVQGTHGIANSTDDEIVD